MIPVQDSGLPPGWIVIPTGMTPRFIEFWDSISLLKVPDGTGRGRNSGPDCDSNRNRNIRTMLSQTDAQWAFFVDDDQEFPQDTLMTMLKIMYNGPVPIDVLTGTYIRKTPPFQPVLFGDADHTAETRFTISQLSEYRKQGHIVQVGACGAGCLLVKRHVLESVYQASPNGTKYWFVPGPYRMFGGDIGYCQMLKAAGVNIYAWLEGIGHIMPSVLKLVWDEAQGAYQLEFTFSGKGFRVNFVEELRDDPRAG